MARWRRCSWPMTVPSAMLNAANRLVMPCRQVVVGAPLGHARHHRQHRLGPVQRLDLGLLVDAEHDGLLGRVVVEADDVDDLLDELRVGGQLEGVLQVRLEVELLPDPPDGRFRQPAALGHRRPGPVRVAAHSGPGVDSSVATITSSTWSSSDRGRPARARLVRQPVQAALDEPCPPALHGRGVDAELGGDLLVRSRPRRTAARSSRAAPGTGRSSPAAPTAAAGAFPRREHQLGLRPPDRPGVLQPGQPLRGEQRPPPARRRVATPRPSAPPAGSTCPRRRPAQSAPAAQPADPSRSPVAPARHARRQTERSGQQQVPDAP